MTGFESQTTFWMDFTFAEYYGAYGIRDTYSRAFHGWKKDVEYMTELVMVLNWKLWFWYNRKEPCAEEYSEIYNELYEKASEYCLDHFDGEELQYYLRTVD